MTAVLNIVFAGIAGLAILATLYFGGRAIIRRGRSTESVYNVGRQEARRAVQIDLIRALASIVIALILLGAFGLTPGPTEPLSIPTLPVLLQETEVPLPTLTPVSTDLPPVEQPDPTAEPTIEPEQDPTLPPTDLPDVEPTDTTEPVVETAVVSSGVGVWLRAAPSTSGEQLEWLLDGTILILLDDQETADNLVWQQVQTEAGVVGWVAADFIVPTE